jgi:hypothetical protein
MGLCEELYKATKPVMQSEAMLDPDFLESVGMRDNIGAVKAYLLARFNITGTEATHDQMMEAIQAQHNAFIEASR